MSEFHEGGCQCGGVRYRTTGEPAKTIACHCRYCQTRTGSALGISVYFRRDKVEILSGDLKTYAYTTESGRKTSNQFCANCGTNVFWTLEMAADLIGVAGGSFDPPTFWYPIEREVFCRSKAPFLHVDAQENHETTGSYAPGRSEDSRLTGG